MDFIDLPDHKKKQVTDLLLRTIKREEFTQQTFNDIDTDVIECFNTSLSNALEPKLNRENMTKGYILFIRDIFLGLIFVLLISILLVFVF